MNKLLIATLIGTMTATMSLAATDAVAQTAQTEPSTHATTPAKKKTGKAPAPKHRLVKRKPRETTAKADPIPVGSVEWQCNEGLTFNLKGDMKRDRIVTVHWANKNYDLPRETTTTGADRFYDAATGLDLVVIPTKAMLFSDHDGSRLADECKTADMVQGVPAPTQSNALKGD
jgi:hypothetical protein